MDNIPTRKSLRLKEYDYSQDGYYFVTVCTVNRKRLLGQIDLVGRADPCAPKDINSIPINFLTDYGKIAKRYLQSIEKFYKSVNLDKYVIMPNHIHAIIVIKNDIGGQGSARPTNTSIHQILHAFKRLTNKECGFNIWQNSFYDHIIRNEQDYLRICEYIDTNIVKWADDEYYN